MSSTITKAELERVLARLELERVLARLELVRVERLTRPLDARAVCLACGIELTPIQVSLRLSRCAPCEADAAGDVR